MALLAPFDRPLALRVRGEVGRPRAAAAPPIAPLTGRIYGPSETPTSRSTLPEIARFLARALLTDMPGMAAVLPDLEASVDEDVVVWSPCVSTRSRTELVTALLEGDDSISDVRVSILGTSRSGSTVFVEWGLEGHFDNAGFVNDDVLIEPSGATVQATGVCVIEFRHHRAIRIRCYYDSLSLFEQVMGPADP
ncbi:MAG: nuclear transport factor 2 family protein, partial [Acidimicrobiales bacterium]